MSAECWTKPSDQKIRLNLCGHVIKAEDLPHERAGKGGCLFSCPLCGMPQMGTREQQLALRDGVPAYTDRWETGECAASRNLADPGRGQGHVQDVGALLARMSDPDTAGIDLQGGSLSPGPHVEQLGPPGCLVLRAAPAGTRVKKGWIVLRAGTVMFLSGRGACFQDVSFLGVTLVCSGTDHAAAFLNCRFEGSTVYAVHGAAVTLRSCTHHACSPAAVASGAASTLHAHACLLLDCSSGVVAEAGATAAIATCAFTSAAPLIVRGTGSRVGCDGCRFHGGMQGHALVVDCGTAMLRRCHMEGFGHGLLVRGPGAVVEMHHSLLYTCVSVVHVAAAGDARLSVRECELVVCDPPGPTPAKLAQARAAPAVFAGGGQGMMLPVPVHSGRQSMLFERCRLSGSVSAEPGVMAANGATVAMVLTRIRSRSTVCAVLARDCGSRAVLAHCAVRNREGHGCNATGAQSTLRIVGGRVVSSGSACASCKGGAVAVRGAVLALPPGCRPQEDHMPAVCSFDGSSMKMWGCTIRKVFLGACVQGDSVLEVRDTDMSGPGEAVGDPACELSQGFMVEGGRLTVTGGSVQGFHLGAGLHSTAGSGSARGDASVTQASFHGVKFLENAQGLTVFDAQAVSAVCCEFTVREPLNLPELEEGEHVAGVTLYAFKAASIRQCSFSGHEHEVSILSKSDNVVGIEGCVFAVGEWPCPWRATAIYALGAALVSDCSFKYSKLREWGILVRSHSSTVRRCSFHGCSESVTVEGGACVDVQSCELVGSRVCVSANTEATATVQDCKLRYRQAGTAVGGGASVVLSRTAVTPCSEELYKYHQSVNVNAHESVAGVRVPSACVAEGCSLSGPVAVSCGGSVVLRGCEISSRSHGLSVRAGCEMRVHDSKVTACSVGVMVLQNPTPAQCYACCRRGADVLVAALWKAAQVPLEGGAASAGRCEHEGAVAMVTLEGVRLLGCATGLQARDAACVTATDVHAVDCRTGFDVMCMRRRFPLSGFRGCSVSVAGEGAVKAWRRLGPEGGFELVEDEVPLEGIEVHPMEGIEVHPMEGIEVHPLEARPAS